MNLPIKVIDAGYAPQTFDMAGAARQEPEGGRDVIVVYR